MYEPFLATKLLLPTSRGDLVSRKHLFELLDQSLSRKLTVVSAPAGFGKTTLVGEWIKRREISAAWLSLDENDNDLIPFLSYFIKALQTISSNFGETILDILQSPQAKVNDPLLITLINEIASTLPHDFVFVLDDYHLVESPRIHEIVAFILNNLPPSIHMMVATRSDPSLPIALLRGRGELLELRQGDLQFTIEETAQYLNQAKGFELTQNQVAALANRTEGWISGLQMAAISMQRREDISTFVQSFTGSNRYVFDYLIEEILNHQPENIQEFLLHTSILDRLTGDLCNAVMDQANSQSILEYLEHSNLFIVPLDDDRQWYRYHHLLADLLQKQLGQKRPELVHGLHQRASSWFDKHKIPENAITHALAARDYELAAHILEQNIVFMMGRGQMSLIERFFGKLPGEIVHNHPILSIQRIWGLALSGRLDEAKGKLREIENQPDTVESKEFSGNIALIRALIANIQGDDEIAISLANRADNLLSAENMVVRSMIPYILGNGYLASGNLGKAEQAFEQIKQIGIETNNLWTKTVAYHRLAQLKKLRGRLKEAQALCEELLENATVRRVERYGFFCEIYFELGDVLREYNDLEAAREMVNQALDHLEFWGIPTDLVIGHTTLARICLAQGDMDSAANAIRKAQSVSRSNNIFRIIQKKFDACQVQLWLQQENLIDASKWANEIEAASNKFDQGQQIDFVNEVDFIMLARVWMAKSTKEQNKSQLDRANHLLSSLASSAQDGHRFGRLIEILALQAIVLVHLGDENRALEALENCMSLAQPEGYMRVFLDEEQVMQNLLFRAQKKGSYLPYIERLLSAFDENISIEGKGLPHLNTTSLPEPLSDREMEVLMLLPTRLTATEMAEKLIVAKSTIDTHIKHIYSKLGVNRRMEAIQRAKELNLL